MPRRTKIAVSAAPDLDAPLQQERAWSVRIREPVGAIRLAVQILAGPLRGALDQLDDVSRARVRSVLDALEASTRQVCELMTELPLLLPVAANMGPGIVAPAPAPAKARAKAVRPAPPPVVEPPPVVSHAVDVDELLRRLEIVTVTRSALPMLLAVDAREGLKAADAGRELLSCLVGLLDRAAKDSARARPGGRPWTIEVRAFLDPAEVLGDEMHVVLEIRHDGTPLHRGVGAWLEGAAEAPSDEPALVAARAVAQGAGGRLEALCAGAKTAIRLRLPESR
jgi:hypothetical protein